MPNRAADLVWEEPEPAPAGGLTRARIVATALALADAQGLDAVSIRRVAGALEMRPMSLYTHIASKDDLVALMLNEVSGELLVQEPLPDDWRAALSAIARRAHAVYVAHPWMLQTFGRAARVGPNLLRRAEQSAAAVAGLNAAPADAWTALTIVHEWTMGHALHTLTLREDSQLEERLQDADAASFPRMTRVFPPGQRRAREETFETALEAVLDGIERRFLAH
ncbi:TetR/AcrR family transcriptional regulator C-terminal domain-containing protein [Conexibacter sp. JD483]|uniref:TetR/AcrR family transcriptional regulator n=1 Tax=unclassified Conexibacter TaxID=2627773 RepID=UPI00271CB86C|nr:MULTISPECIES: TetR/AcrR family transcriptional regulator C-terminal domain-containing protein [unclassified Conexibacter]MDO8185540.1 TetR/AcrR family transcriptional regulator C-terminal domain-containing protein [Conexibacter sp. CPCC 205706]MDO8197273.1 TetR/AcrR family transcriptional regulator C-terminal domain-containing protein [Conexibacter sp. CPCC 205762]MDR9370769.1 TetR/AcrR family transcriptional regulator C-terminal domain-containing protein [Conexibacter sp. JD483]